VLDAIERDLQHLDTRHYQGPTRAGPTGDARLVDAVPCTPHGQHCCIIIVQTH
jgi:hypothetical protein